MTMRRLIVIVGLVLACSGPIGAGQRSPDPEVLFQSALYKEQVELKLQDAIAGYKEVLSAAGPNRTIAAKALLQMAGCYERLGDQAALPTYQRILAEYADAGAAAASARTKVAAFEQTRTGPVSRQISGNFTPDYAVSPDGRYMAYLDDHNDVGRLDLDTGRRRLLTTKAQTTESFASRPAVSPDSKWIVYGWYDSDSDANDLRIVSSEGGTPRTVRTYGGDGAVPWGWTPDGKSILVRVWRGTVGSTRTSDLVLMPATGSGDRVLLHLDDNQTFSFAVSPDARFVGYDRPSTAGKSERDIFSLDVETGRTQTLLKHEADDYLLGWHPDGARILFASDRGGDFGIWQVPVVNGRAVGSAVSVKPGTGRIQPLRFTRSGDFYYGSFAAKRNVMIATLDPATGKAVGALKPIEGRYDGGMNSAAWSPDGQRLAYVQFTNPRSALGPAGFPQNQDVRLAIQHVATGQVRLLALPFSDIGTPMWSSDGTSVVILAKARAALVRVDVETGEASTVIDTSAEERPFTWAILTPDGARLFGVRARSVLAERGNERGANVRVRDLRSGSEQDFTTEPVGGFLLSPDGRWLVTTRFTQPDQSVFVMPSIGGEKRLLTTTGSWPLPPTPIGWTADSRAVFVSKANMDRPFEIWQIPLDGSAPRNTGITSDRPFNRISAHPDGRQVVLSQVGNQFETWVLSSIPRIAVK